MVRALHHHRMVESMGRVGAAGDNAAMESFFSLLQRTSLTGHLGHPRRAPHRHRDLHRTHLPRRRRRQKRLNGLTPIEYEAIMNTDVALAA